MLYLYTGTPGHGKTQRALFDAINDARFKGRHVYWTGVNGLVEDAPEFKRWSHLEDIKKWQECEPGSVILVDEAHKEEYFPLRGVGKPPKWIEDIAEHRHLGLDFILITQNAKDVDVFIRRRIETHYHMKRPAQLFYTNVYSFQGFVDCDDKIPADTALKHEKWALDKHIWKLYKSADAHTNKAKLPRILYWFPVIFLVIGGAIFWLYHDFKKRVDPNETAKAMGVAPASSVSAAGKSNGREASRTEAQSSLSRMAPAERVEYQMHETRDWSFSRIPLNPDYPESAPLYEDLREVKTFPIVAGCIVTKAECKCVNQQGTPERITPSSCFDFVVNGRFNPYLDENKRANEQKPVLQTASSTLNEKCSPYLVYGVTGQASLETRCNGSQGAGALPSVLSAPGSETNASGAPSANASATLAGAPGTAGGAASISPTGGSSRSTAAGPGRGGYVQ